MAKIRRLNWRERRKLEEEYGVRISMAEMWGSVKEAYRHMPKNGFCVLCPNGDAIAIHVKARE